MSKKKREKKTENQIEQRRKKTRKKLRKRRDRDNIRNKRPAVSRRSSKQKQAKKQGQAAVYAREWSGSGVGGGRVAEWAQCVIFQSKIAGRKMLEVE